MVLPEIDDALFKALDKKFIIFTAGYKGGIGKSIISLGLAKELNIPYLTNDRGSAISGKISFYENSYFTYDFKITEDFKKANVVIIDLAGCFTFDKVILKLIEKANLIILPTGENPYLDFTGCLFTASNLYELNKNLMFIMSNISEIDFENAINSFKIIKDNYENFKNIKVFGLTKNNMLINESLANKINYTQASSNLNKDDSSNKFISLWQDIIDEVVTQIKKTH